MASPVNPANPTTGSELDAAVRASIARNTILANAQLLVWDSIAEIKESVRGTGAIFPIMGAIAAATSALSATANPEPTQLSDSTATITTAEYGVPVELGRKLMRNSEASVFNDAIAVLARNMAETVDSLGGAAAVGGSTVRFAAGRANKAALTSADVLTKNEIVRAKAVLEAALAPVMMDGTYAACLHPYSVADLFGTGGTLGDFLDVSKYAAPDMVRTGEIGRWMGFTFYSASQRTYTALSAGANDNTRDRTLSVFCGGHFLGKAIGLEPRILPARDANDVLNRFIMLGWHGDFGYGRIKEANGYRIEAASAYAPNP